MYIHVCSTVLQCVYTLNKGVYWVYIYAIMARYYNGTCTSIQFSKALNATVYYVCIRYYARYMHMLCTMQIVCVSLGEYFLKGVFSLYDSAKKVKALSKWLVAV